ncbi:MAG: CoB--CoM heterodisulfide reductase iron-sulfur subunit A family protein, partial [Clostridiales bacterium]|nr:CoB--CoM heterodisulfide reductase iron-sulfur subunit A family protein [Clostridiales bacterium]
MINKTPKAVLVIGGGIAGIQAATDLAENGVPVYLVESAPSIGGRMAQLDKTFPTNDCSTCILAPKMSDCFNHPNIRTYTYSEVAALEGGPGEFRATIRKKPRYIDEELCTGCGLCMEKCPQKKIPDRFDQGIGFRKAIYKEFGQGVPNIVTIDPEACLMLKSGKCGLCSKVCQAKAVKYDQKEELIELEVASVVFAPGFEVFEGSLKEEYGYKRFPNVVSSLDYERMMSASGPLGGHITRPSDKKEPKRIAFMQCVGSRDHSCGNDYCSSVCCMYAIKEAIITKEHIKGIQGLDIYFMDLRAYGKDFDKYHHLAQDKYGVGFVRSRTADIEEDKDTGDLLVKSVAEDGSVRTDRYDLVVLSVGLKPRPEVTEM